MKTLLIASLALVLGSASAQARWLKEDEAAAHFEEINTEVRIHKDYSVEVTQDLSAVVDKASAIDDLSLFRVLYSPSTAQVKILSARVVVRNRVTFIDPKLVEDKPIPDQKGGYEPVHEVRVAFPNVEVGTTIEVKLWRRENIRSIPGAFSHLIGFANTYPVKAQHLRLESDAPIAWKVHDPFKELTLTEGKGKKGVKLEIAAEKTVFHQLVEEPFAAFSEPQLPALYLSSGSKWAELGNKVSAEYEKVLAAPLPDELKKAIEPLKANPDKLEVLEIALSQVGKLVRPIGSWQMMNGQFFPRPLKETIANRFADANDYAAVSVAALHALGIEAQIAWTQVDLPGATSGRVIGFQPPVAGLYFNHAIVKAKVAGKDLWFDPASPVAFARGIAGHLAGDYALVLKAGDSKFEIIPFATAEDNTIEATRYLTVNNDKTFDEVIQSKVKGIVSAIMTAPDPENEEKQLLRAEDDSVNDLLLKGAGPKPAKGEVWVDRARGGADLGGGSPTGAGVKFGLPKDLGFITQDPSKISGGVFLPVPTKQTLTTIIQGGSLSGEPPKECKVETPFFNLSRVFSREYSIVRVVESSEMKTGFISAADIQGPQMKAAKEALAKCWTDATLVFLHDGLIDPKFSYHHELPWKVTGLQLKAEGVKKSIPKFWSKITGKQATEKSFTYVKIAPEWSKDKTPEQVKAKVREFIDDWTGQDVKPLLVKMLMLEQIQKTPQDPELFAYIALAELQAGFVKGDENDPKAVERARWAAYSALEIAPKNPLANRALAQVLALAKDGAVALEAAKFALGLEPESVHGKTTLARAYLASGDPKKALETLGAIEDFGLREAIYTVLKNTDKIGETYEAELKKKPTVWTYVKYANFANNQGEPDRAIELAKKALELRDLTVVHKILSEAYVRKGSAAMDKSKKVEDGLEWLGKALVEDNTNVLAHQIVGSILIQRGRQTKDERLMAMGAHHARIATKLQMEESNEGRAPASAPAVAPAPTTPVPVNGTPAPGGAPAKPQAVAPAPGG